MADKLTGVGLTDGFPPIGFPTIFADLIPTIKAESGVVKFYLTRKVNTVIEVENRQQIMPV